MLHTLIDDSLVDLIQVADVRLGGRVSHWEWEWLVGRGNTAAVRGYPGNRLV